MLKAAYELEAAPAGVRNFEILFARIYADLWSGLSKKGNQTGAHDLIIGSTALSLGF